MARLLRLPRLVASRRPAPQLDRLSQALSLAVHELRTPLAVVSGYLRMLLHEQAGAITDQQRTVLGAAHESCARVGALIAEMSALGQLEGGDAPVARVRFDLAALIDELASGPIEGDDGSVRCEVRATRPVMVAGDRARLAAGLRALVHAARRERSEPGVILIECSTVPDADQTWATVTIGSATARRSPVDTAPDAAPFDEWRGGLGLALPIARRVIEAHGGALWSAPGGTPRAGCGLRLPVAPSALDDVSNRTQGAV